MKNLDKEIIISIMDHYLTNVRILYQQNQMYQTVMIGEIIKRLHPLRIRDNVVHVGHLVLQELWKVRGQLKRVNW